MNKFISLYEHQEGLKFLTLMKMMKAAQHRGHMTKMDLIAVCEWKSSRARPLCSSNHTNTIKAASMRSFQTTNEAERMENLLTLSGVGIPMASAILAAMNPRQYGVIDIRVWQALHHFGEVATNPSGKNLRLSHWISYLKVIRKYAAKHAMTAREIEKAIFNYHKEKLQEGTLYGE